MAYGEEDLLVGGGALGQLLGHGVSDVAFDGIRLMEWRHTETSGAAGERTSHTTSSSKCRTPPGSAAHLCEYLCVRGVDRVRSCTDAIPTQPSH